MWDSLYMIFYQKKFLYRILKPYICAHTQGMPMHAFSMCVHGWNMHMHLVGFASPKHPSSEIFTILSPISILGLRVMSSLGNEGSSHKKYKMRCLQLPLFWFVSSANKIKRKRDKIFCFDVRLKPNPSIWQTTCIHGVGCNFEKLCRIRMSEVPQVLLEKWVITDSLSKSLVCQGKWLIILESLRRKSNIANDLNHQLSKQGALTS